MKESYPKIDALVRQRLAALPPATIPPAGWESLERELDAAADASLREALSGLEVTPVPGWAALAEKLDERSPDDLSLASRLNGLEGSIAAGSWAVLTNRMDQQTAANVDGIIVSRLDAAAPLVVSGWATLAARLELIGWRRETLMAWKTIEFTLLASLLLLLVRFVPSAEPTQVPLANNTGFYVAETPVTQAPREVMPPITGEQPAVRATAKREAQQNVSLRLSLAESPKKGNSAPPAVTISSAQGTVEDGRTSRVIAPLPQQTIPLLEKTVERPLPVITLPESRRSEPVLYYSNFFVSPLDVNEVVTQRKDLDELEVSAGRRLTNGVSLGALLDFVQGRNGLQIGLVVSQRSYRPTSQIWRSNIQRLEGYEQFRYTTLELPFNYKRILRETDRWRISGRLGMSMNIIVSSEFIGRDGVAESIEKVQAEGRAIPGPVGLQTSQLANVSDRRAFREPGRGWLEGGGLLTNSTFYLGGGLVFERLINSRLSVYASPSFGRVIYLDDRQGIGPTNDRIHSGSVRFGSRFLLGGK